MKLLHLKIAIALLPVRQALQRRFWIFFLRSQASCSWLPQPQLKFAIAALLTVHETALLDNRDSFAASEASFATSFLEVKIFLLCYDLKLAMMALPAICQLGKL